MTTIIARRKPDGTLVRVHEDGREEVIHPRPIRDMTEEEILEAALSDPDAQPITPERRARMKPRPRVFVIRRALRLTQEEFAARYQIPIGTLRDWEQGRSEPDQAARAYLKVIAKDPEGVARALAPPTGQPTPA